MDVYLRRVIHPQATDSFRVIVKEDGDEIEVGSIGVRFDGWHWGIDCVVPMRELEMDGSGKDRRDCMEQFRAAWNRLAADPARVIEFLEQKRKRLR